MISHPVLRTRFPEPQIFNDIADMPVRPNPVRPHVCPIPPSAFLPPPKSVTGGAKTSESRIRSPMHAREFVSAPLVPHSLSLPPPRLVPAHQPQLRTSTHNPVFFKCLANMPSTSELIRLNTWSWAERSARRRCRNCEPPAGSERKAWESPVKGHGE